jgi:phosphopantetheine adenylyltransferase
LLLTAAAIYATKEVIIGLAGTELLAKKSHQEMIQPYGQREKAVLDFLKTVKPHLNYQPVEIQVRSLFFLFCL